MNARILALTFIAALGVARPATADAPTAKVVVDEGKTQGHVGEQADGFLGFVDEEGDASLRAAVAEINAGRARLYAELAEHYGIDPALVGASSFEQRFASIPAGQWYRDRAGIWRRK